MVFDNLTAEAMHIIFIDQLLILIGILKSYTLLLFQWDDNWVCFQLWYFAFTNVASDDLLDHKILEVETDTIEPDLLCDCFCLETILLLLDNTFVFVAAKH